MTERMVEELRRTIETLTGCRTPRPERRFHRHDEYRSYGLKTPDFHRLMADNRDRFLALTLPERLWLALRLLEEQVGELGHAGIHLVALSADELKPDHYPTLDRMVEDFRSWSQVDHFCGKVLPTLLAGYPEPTLALLDEWSRSTNRWKRRASVVAFTRRVAAGRFVDVALRRCNQLADDPEDIVRKGVGWALKDLLKAAPERVLACVRELRRRGVSSTVTLYAIRDLKGEERAAVLRVKKCPQGSNRK